MITQAFVLGAGLGTRMRPLTDSLPKPLMPVFGKPLITFALDHLGAVGIESFVINTHHLSKHFENFFADGMYAERPIKLVHEPTLLETGGGIKNVEHLLGRNPFIVYSGDLLTDIELEPLIEEHFRARNDVTLALRETGLASEIAFKNDRVVDIQNRYGHVGNFDFANVSVWSPKVFERIPPQKKISFIPILAEWVGQNGKIGGVVLNDRHWFNIGSRAQYLGVHRTIDQGNWMPGYVKTLNWPQRIGNNVVIDPSARLVGSCSIGAGCRIGAEATLEDTILWPGAQVASRTHLRNCIVRCDQKAEGNLHDVDI